MKTESKTIALMGEDATSRVRQYFKGYRIGVSCGPIPRGSDDDFENGYMDGRTYAIVAVEEWMDSDSSLKALSTLTPDELFEILMRAH